MEGSFSKASVAKPSGTLVNHSMKFNLALVPQTCAFHIVHVLGKSSSELAPKIALAELCSFSQGSEFLCCPAGDTGVYVLGDVKEAMNKLRAAAAQCHFRVTKMESRKSEDSDNGAPSSVVNEVVSFQLSTHLRSAGYTSLRGHWTTTAGYTSSKRPGLALSLSVSAEGQVTVVLDRGSLIVGTIGVQSSRLVPGERLYALPSNTPVTVAHVSDTIDPKEPFGKHDALQRYWTAVHHIDPTTLNGSLYVRVKITGDKLFTYPSKALLTSPLEVKAIDESLGGGGGGHDHSKEAQRNQIAELRARMFRDVGKSLLFRGGAKED